jgi:chromosome segregation ATPase
LKSTVREQQKDLLEKTRCIGRKVKDFDDLREESDMKLEQAVARLNEEATHTQQRLHDAEKVVKEAEAAAQVEEQRMQGLVDSLREKNAALVQKLEGNLRSEIDSGRRLTSSNRELTANCALLSEEKGMLVVVIEEARSTVSDLQEDLISARETILDLTEALSDSHNAREEASERASKVLEALEPHRHSKSRRSAIVKDQEAAE